MKAKAAKIFSETVFKELKNNQNFSLREMLYFSLELLKKTVEWAETQGKDRSAKRYLFMYAYRFVKEMIGKNKERDEMMPEAVNFANRILDLALKDRKSRDRLSSIRSF